MSHEPRPQQKKPRAPRKITPDYLHNAGLHYLQRFPASTAHFHKVMSRKIERSYRWHHAPDPETSQEWLNTVINDFQAAGLLNDEHYSHAMVTSLRRRGLSARAIEARLAVKGLPTALIKQHITQHDQTADEQYNQEGESYDGDFRAALILARRKKIGPFRHPDKPFSPEKELAKLARAGFSYDIAQKVLAQDNTTI